MNARGLRRYLDDLLRGRKPAGFKPDDFDAAQMRTAIDLHAARPGADEPRPEFLADLQHRLAGQFDGAAAAPPGWLRANRRQVIVGTSAAASAAVAAVAVDRTLVGGRGAPTSQDTASQELVPNSGSWQKVADSAAVSEGAVHPFDLGTVVGFVRRVDGRVQGISGVCTHQGCRLWFDAPDDRLRCPCHSTSFATDGHVLTHQLPIAPKPLPKFDVREVDGVIEVFAPAPPNRPA
ncbi:Rieske (2Fe-2S) protein [Mycobacterium sp. CBMA293]|uniref:Rieske (2Fe-2S) protein n=1 Tax=unclassified Mycolicibacterium TaxID=2636767 RepID=UPI0012DD7BCE|nr:MULTISPECIES: Rieske (2Fe-2S) protein [unclassified Mycolicibacterium]MUL45393.1 Rieske (2Fe-2S) protein [Mycolicibacterium sp. CBMA 360]MUL56913.1 Rieske (2Fe-2S) protein [Mycolicibacterium sp. CBMA 335]MUL69953.1 Rieske (2Fe-2S) protein [Mycolicibacterium sp. CBMA 311]MUL92001.1 Rieske (2Fe-2S) protein [Mycolicibacterium sp. CBMA 230]MUM05739.1 (2Fe-2S)-binding protein [Mycolicibacterium sp. CBMA 213]